MTDFTVGQLNEDAANIAGMLGTPGWMVIESEAKERTAKLSKMLIWCDDEKQIRDLQANIRSLEFLLSFPREVMEAARRSNEEAAQVEPDSLPK